MRSPLALAAAVTAATLVVGVPATASAQTWRHTDPAGDVVRLTYDTDDDTESTVVDPSIAAGDAIGTTIRHNPRKLVVTMRFRQLAPTTDAAEYGVRGRHRAPRWVSVTTDAEHPRGVQQVLHRDKGPVRCRGLAHTLDRAAATVTISVPRACLGRPTALRAAAVFQAYPGDDGEASGTDVLADDALHRGLSPDGLGFSPLLRRG